MNFAPVGRSEMPQGSTANGRIDLLSSMPEFNISSFQGNRTVDNTNFANEATYGRIQPTDVSRIFFSEQNINALHTGIRYRIYVETNGRHVLGRQSDQELKIIMRSIYLQYSKNQPSNCVEQVRELNSKVLEWAVPEVLSNLKQFEVYRKDASTMPLPMDHPSFQATKGTKVLEQKKWM